MVTVGIDEVGRGCWAGPLVAGAVILSRPIPGLKDSKKLTKIQREFLAHIIASEGHTYALGWVTPAEIDRIGLTEAVRLAMHRAVQKINQRFDKIIIDGNYNFFPKDIRATAVIKADDTEPAVSAASIIAKVVRDKYMANLAAKYPEYGFDKHVGYGTQEHKAALHAFGVTAHHRLSYKPVAAIRATIAK